MNIRTLTFIALLAGCNLAFAEGNATDSGFAFGGNFYLALQNWPNISTSNDSKTGAGFALNLGIGYKIDKDFTLLVGPQLATNRWDSTVVNGVYAETDDAGLQLTADFGDMLMTIGGGSSKPTVGASGIGSITTTQTYPYTAFDIGFKSGIWYLGLGVVNYSGAMKSTYNRGQIELGFAF